MNLPPTSPTDIHAESPSLADQPAHQRYPCVRSTVVRLLARPSFQSFQASVYDVSIREIGLIVGRSFDPGTMLAVLLQTKNAGISGILSAKVREASPQSDGYWLLDCTLSRSLTDDEIFSLL
jgi:hypothetical protein